MSLPASASVLARSGFLGARPDWPDAARAAAALRARDARGRAVRQGRVAEPRRVGEGPRRRADDCSTAKRRGALTARSDDPRRHVGQHRDRLRDGRRGARLQGEAVPAGEREPRAKADPARVRRRARADRSARRAPTARSAKCAGSSPTSPDAYFYPDQYSNDANWRAHFDTTGPEIIEQTGGRLTHFVAGLGTSGTFIGTGRALRQFNPAIRLISFQPDSPFHGLEGLKHMATAIVPAIYDPSLADEDLRVEHRGRAHGWCGGWRGKKGCWSGISSGAALAAALEVARRLDAGRGRDRVSGRRGEVPDRDVLDGGRMTT